MLATVSITQTNVKTDMNEKENETENASIITDLWKDWEWIMWHRCCVRACSACTVAKAQLTLTQQFFSRMHLCMHAGHAKSRNDVLYAPSRTQHLFTKNKPRHPE